MFRDTRCFAAKKRYAPFLRERMETQHSDTLGYSHMSLAKMKRKLEHYKPRRSCIKGMRELWAVNLIFP
jgi:hypothetical protein